MFEARPHRVLALALALLVLSVPAGPAAADIVPPGKRYVQVEHIVDLGPYADFTSRSYTVRKGDTLSQIAEEQLGSLRRMKEILKANPGLKADDIGVGDSITLPPRRQPATLEALEQGLVDKDAKPWFDFFVMPDPAMRGELLPFPADGRLQRGNYNVMVVAVPHERAAEFKKGIKAAAKDWKSLEKYLGTSWIYEGPRFSCRETVGSASEVRVRRYEWSVKSVANGKLELGKATIKTLDAAGEPVSEVGTKRNAVFFFLAFVGLFGLYALWRSRRPNEMVVKVEG